MQDAGGEQREQDQDPVLEDVALSLDIWLGWGAWPQHACEVAVEELEMEEGTGTICIPGVWIF